jgi:hypothetical protein
MRPHQRAGRAGQDRSRRRGAVALRGVGDGALRSPRRCADAARSYLFCSGQPRGRSFVVRVSGGGLQGVLGGVHDQVPFIILLARTDVAEGNRNILFAHPQKSANANDQGGDTPFFVDKHVIDVADRIV